MLRGEQCNGRNSLFGIGIRIYISRKTSTATLHSAATSSEKAADTWEDEWKIFKIAVGVG
jgi:hypothetical protein